MENATKNDKLYEELKYLYQEDVMNTSLLK